MKKNVMSENLRKMIALADEVFDARNDPDQLNVTPKVMEQLQSIHPSTLSETIVDDGPVCWVLLIPSSIQTMQKFLDRKIHENEILESSVNENHFEAIYLCSALVLPEFRNQGIAFRSALQSIKEIQASFKITCLYSWPFSKEGKLLSEKLSAKIHLPLHILEGNK